MLGDPRRLDGVVPAHAVRLTGGTVGQDPGQLVDQRPALVPAAAAQLGPHDVDAALQQAADVREVGLLLLGLVTT